MLVYGRQSACHTYESDDDTLVQEPSCKIRILDLGTDDPFHEVYTAWILFLVISL